MRTLKKVLALSLVFAMAFTMMAGAAFKDQDKIDSALTDDIQLLTALGVFQGDENGNFNPTDNVKRSEAAKMIYVLKNNGVDDGAVAFQGVSKYSDVPVGHWAEGYINYCTNLGYMGGWQENGVQKFDPNGNVTGVELMKMLLCMIGYKADIQGYTGNGWQTNVLVDAAVSGLTVEFTPSVYAATPRQWTARLMTNAIDAPYVSYNRGELQFGNATDSNRSYGQQYLGLETVEGTLNETNHNKLATATSTNKYSISAALNDEDTVRVDKADGSKVYAQGDADDSLLGQPVKMYYKVGTGTSENKLYAVLPYAKDEKVITTDVDAITVKKQDDGSYKVTVDGLGTKTYNGDSFAVYSDNILIDDAATSVDKYLGNNVNDQVTLIADKNTNMIKTVQLHTTMAFAKVDKLDADKGIFALDKMSTWLQSIGLKDESGKTLTFNSSNKDNFAKYLNVDSKVEVGSFVKIVLDISSGKPVYNVTLADKVEGTVASYTLNNAGDAYSTLNIGGSDYKLAAGGNYVDGYTWNLNTVNKHDTFYTDGKYVVYSTGSKAGATVDNLAMVTKTTTTIDSWTNPVYKVKALLTDGTTGEYTVNAVYDEAGVKIAKADEVAVLDGDSPIYSLSGNSWDLTKADRYKAEDAAKNALAALFTADTGKANDKVFTYSLTDDGKINLSIIKTEGKLDATNATYMNGTVSYTQKTGIATIGGEQYRTTADTYFFVKDTTNKEYSVVKASELKKDVTANTANTFVAQKVNGFATLLAGVLDISSVPTAKAMDYYFVTGNATNKGLVDGKYVVELPVNAAGENTVLTFKYDAQSAADAGMAKVNALKGKLVTVDLKADGSVDTGSVTSGNVEGLTVISLTDTINVKNSGWYKASLATWDNDGKLASVDGQIVKIADDVKVYNVNVADDNKSAELVEGDSTVKSEDKQQSVALYINADEEISAIFCETEGMNIDFIATK